jgi:hypothetical protein
MFGWDSVFARHDKFDRSALAEARDMGSSARIDPAAEEFAKLPAKAEIAEKDAFSQILSCGLSQATSGLHDRRFAPSARSVAVTGSVQIAIKGDRLQVN